MIKTLLEQWKADKEQKRKIQAEKWEQEKAWREEDRRAKLQKEAEQEQVAQQKQQEKEEEKARREETYGYLFRAHLEVMDKAATVSYVSLTCHEDTWAFLARRAFGAWSPEWLTSVPRDESGLSGPDKKENLFKKDPNLAPGRIVKLDNGMQTVDVSGDNLVTILEELWNGAWGNRNAYLALMDTDPNRRACGPLYKRFETWLHELDADSVSEPGHTLVLDERVDAGQATPSI
ncbi:hypothetical protein VSR01_00140 [Actinacidiphila sp. DG2A-62]|uniref:hypothetical protein n=1 Tax=Actinacidiphila sp. DG2A-62 TaxID=3108821 RepID=UPI002DB6AB4A|nr:hypothetical protein [Actinacidiphila sp. DG2A-62]MEC3992038.1 hypothetical protein [Actinacidiphila sp. DG2A-62]